MHFNTWVVTLLEYPRLGFGIPGNTDGMQTWIARRWTQRDTDGMQMERIWNVDGSHMERKGTQMERRLNAKGKRMEHRWNTVELFRNTENPKGIQRNSNG